MEILFPAQPAHLCLGIGEDVFSLKEDFSLLNFSGRHAEQAHDGQGCHALAAARFTDNAQNFPLIDEEIHAVDGAETLAPGRKGNGKVLISITFLSIG